MTSLQADSRVVPLFGTPVMTETWANAPRWNSALLDAIMAQRSTSPSVALSNVHGWQSRTDMLDWGGEAAQQLCNHVLECCDRYTVDIREEGRRRFVWLPEMWANVNERGASNQTHCHPGTQWSAVYYVADGYGGSDDPALGGELTFLDPRFPMVRMRDPDLRFRTSSGAVDHHESWIRPATGRIVMFPAWLMHSVRPYNGDDVRISIALNISSRPRWDE